MPKSKKKQLEVKGLLKLDSIISNPQLRRKKFLERLKEGAKYFSSQLKNRFGRVVVITHNDPDGLTSASMLIKFLFEIKAIGIIKVVKNLDYKIIESLAESYRDINPLYVFLDLGTAYSKTIKEKLENVLILDHHQIKKSEFLDGVWHRNPFIFNINGDEEITTGVLTYLFLKNFNLDFKKYIVYAVISIFSDRQEFKGFNKEVLEEAENYGLIVRRKTWKFYGRYSLPIYQAIARYTNVFLEGLTGNQSAVIELLSNLGIDLQNDEGKWKTLEDLGDEDRQKLIEELIIRGAKLEDIYGDVYELNFDFNKMEGLRDIDEISTMINACSRLENPSIAIGFLLGDKTSVNLIEDILKAYRKEIIYILKTINKNKSEYLEVKNEKILIIHGKNLIKDTLLSVIVTILFNSFNYPIVLGYSFVNDKVKVSVRNSLENINIAKIIEEVSNKVKGEGGGHKKAAGAIIPKEYLEDFLEIFVEEVSKKL